MQFKNPFRFIMTIKIRFPGHCILMNVTCESISQSIQTSSDTIEHSTTLHLTSWQAIKVVIWTLIFHHLKRYYIYISLVIHEVGTLNIISISTCTFISMHIFTIIPLSLNTTIHMGHSIALLDAAHHTHTHTHPDRYVNSYYII